MPSISNNDSGRFFLIEFFVDRVYLPDEFFKKDDCTLCVSFQFLQYPVMIVCEEEFSPKNRRITERPEVVFKSGKSCLFSLKPKDNVAPKQFDLIITVTENSKRTSEKLIVGQAVVNFGSSFTVLVKSSISSSLPATLLKQDEFPLRNSENKEIGSIIAFIRLSCFGKLIVTQFQLAGGDDMNYMFKGTDPSSIFKDKDTGKPADMSMENASEHEGDIPGDIPYDEVFGYPKENDDDASKKAERLVERAPELDEEEEEDEDEDEGEEEGEKEELNDQNAEIADKDNLQEEEEDYREIGAEINGHSITIRVLKKRKKTKKQSEESNQICVPPVTDCCSCPDPPCPYAPKLNVCDCDYPLPPALIPRCPRARCCTGQCNPPPNSAVPNSHIQSNIGSYSGSRQRNTMDAEPGVVALKGDQIFFQMPNRPAGEPVNEKERKLANSLYYKFGSTEGGKDVPKQYVQISPQCPGEPLTAVSCGGGTNTTTAPLPNNNKQDSFLLKLQQANADTGTRNKLEMELKTQKPKDPKPETATANTQYLTTDLPPVKKKVNENVGKNNSKKKKK